MKINVNIDQFVMDTWRRELLWNYKRRHKVGFFINRIQWYLYPIIKYIPNFPLHIDFEVSALCNMKCPMCFRQHRKNQEDGLMDLDLYKNAIDECAKFGLYSIRVSWRGEPTINNNLIEMIRYAKERGIKEVSFLTNCLKIYGDYAVELVKTGVDYISISVDGMYEEYDRIRKPAKFEGTVEKIKYLRYLRDTIGKGYPLLKINTIWSQIEKQIPEYYKIFSPLTDIITFNPDYDYTENESHIDATHICQYPYQRLTIKWDGEVPMCISDWDGDVIIGKIGDESLYDIWHGKKLNEIREMHRYYKIRELRPCLKCHRPTTKQTGNQRGIINRNNV